MYTLELITNTISASNIFMTIILLKAVSSFICTVGLSEFYKKTVFKDLVGKIIEYFSVVLQHNLVIV